MNQQKKELPSALETPVKSQNVKLSYEAKAVTLTVASLKYLIQMEHFRNIRTGQVSKLYAALVNGESFPTPLILNVVNLKGEHRERWRIIDGNHRHTALLRFFKNNPTAKVQVLVTRYDGLSTQEEEDIFRKANGGIQMTFTDWVAKNQEHIPVMRQMRNGFPFPIHVYPVKRGQRGWQFNLVVTAYLNREFPKGRILHLDDRVRLVNELDDADYRSLVEFAKDYTEAFGLPSWGAAWARNAGLNALMRVYFWNRYTSERSDIVAAWRDRVAADGAALEIARAGEMSSVPELVQRIVTAMNRGKHKKRFMDSTAFKAWKERTVTKEVES